jgi:TM2 domain-containing membrane protein YozV
MSRSRHSGSRSRYADEADFDDEFGLGFDRREIVVRRAPSPGVAAVLSVLIPGLGQVYGGRLLAGAIWFLATSFCYWAILLPGFIVHAFCIWSAWRGCPRD